MQVTRLLLSGNLRLCGCKQISIAGNNLFSKHENKTYNTSNSRKFSMQSTVESIGRSQTGLFQWLSESKPVELTQHLLLSIHDTTGLPWWATIITGTVLLRTAVTVPLAVYQQYILAKVERIHLEMPDIANELKKEVAYAIKLYKWDEKTARLNYQRSMKKQFQKLIIRDNCHPVKAGLLLWFQIPLWISLSVSLRNIVYELPKRDIDAHVTFTEFCIGGFGWIPNLTEVDSSFILPVTLGLLNLAIIEVQTLSRVQVQSKLQRYATNLFRGISLLMIPIAASVPSCLVLYWTTSSAYGLIQNLTLMSPKVKRFCNIPLTASQLEKPYSHLLAGAKHKYQISIFNKE